MLPLSLMAQAEPHLLITKMLYDAPGTEEHAASSEFVEIYNPTPNPISLNNYYVTDSLNYWRISEGSGGLLNNITTSDFCYKFPAGYTLEPGKVAIVTQSARLFWINALGAGTTTPTDADFDTFYGVNRPLIFEVTREGNTDTNSAPVTGIPKMVQASTNTTNPYTFSFTNGGEFAGLFYWDGSSPLVKDVDLIAWGTPGTQFPQNKSGQTVNGETYLVDSAPTGFAASLPGATHSLYRIFETEVDETSTGGNGITGNDETSENVNTAWGHASHAQLKTVEYRPGLKNNFVTASITSAERDTEFPAPNADIFINALITDPGNSIVSAKVIVDNSYHIASGTSTFPVASGSLEFALTEVNSSTGAWQANIGGYPDKTYVKWYIEAVKSNNEVIRYPLTGEKVFAVDSDPVSEGDIIINELMYDPAGYDNETPDQTNRRPEWVEIYNTTNAPVDLSYFRWSNTTNANGANKFFLPEGTVVPAGGYLVLTASIELFNQQYPDEVSADMLIQYAELPATGSVLTNAGDTVNVVHVNSAGWNGTNVPLDLVPYTNASPWPGDTANNGGSSIELIDTNLDNSVGANWRLSTTGIRVTGSGGSPGKSNNDTSTIHDWNVY